MNQAVIDIRTLLLISTIILACRAALLAYAWVINRTYLPLRYWAIGASLAAVGVLFLSLRGMVPLTASVMIGQAGLILGWMFISAGTITAAERRPPWRWGFCIAAAGLVGALCFLLIWPDYSLRSIAVSLPGLIFDSYSIYASLRFVGGRWRTATFRILALALAVSTVSSLVKHLYMLRSGSNSLFDPSAQSTQYYVLSTVILIICTVLYVLLAAQKSQEELEQEVQQRKQAEEQIRDLVYYDSLTQLPNRRMLTERLDMAIATSKRTGMFGAVMLFDLDNFKPLNDRHGHAAGDLLLIEVAHRLKASLREIDTMSRLGGDEFVVVLASLHIERLMAVEQALAIAEKLRAKLAEPYFLRQQQAGGTEEAIEHHCSASIGVTLFGGEVASQNEVIRQADEAMYQAKKSGGNAIQLFAAASRTRV